MFKAQSEFEKYDINDNDDKKELFKGFKDHFLKILRNDNEPTLFYLLRSPYTHLLIKNSIL